MITKLLVTAAMAAATWLAWRLLASLLASATRPQPDPRRPRRPDPAVDDRTITLVKDPRTGAYRSEDEPPGV